MPRQIVRHRAAADGAASAGLGRSVVWAPTLAPAPGYQRLPTLVRCRPPSGSTFRLKRETLDPEGLAEVSGTRPE
jgi:hypothetical protein